jgi:transcriptional regulator with XRE-family HTH domain
LARGTHDPRYRQLIEALADARRSAGLTQAQLAKKLGRRQQFVSKFEVGERRLDAVEFVDIARTLGIDVGKFLRNL